MNTAKHTPGPWIVDDEVSEDNAGQPTLGIYADGPEAYGYVCGIHCGPDAELTQQDYANAHLIAAAPAMYEALRMLITLDPRCHRGVTHCGECGACLGQVALAQAEGKQ